MEQPEPVTSGSSAAETATRRRYSWRKWSLSILVALIGFVGFELLPEFQLSMIQSFFMGNPAANHICPQASVLTPSAHAELWKFLLEDYNSPVFRQKAADWLGGAVRIRTEVFDDMGPVGSDDRWDIFSEFHAYLVKNFPWIHSTLKLTKVNTHSLLYHWQGSNKALKPLFISAHQDVVPVDPSTEDQWKHPPFSGHFDGKRIWGRGSIDDKSDVISVLSAIESILKQGKFSPTRSVILAFGIDEETRGVDGALELSKEVLSQFGEDSMAMIVNEGGGFETQYGSVFAIPGISEKGYFDVRIEVSSPGGLSSVPPPHTSIGILASLLVRLEDNPFGVHLERGTPMYEKMLCIAEIAPQTPEPLRNALKDSITSDEALMEAEKILFEDATFRSYVGTTQAIDLISGGVKVNALPEKAYAVVNHRISTQSNISFVKDRTISLLEKLSKKYRLGFDAFEQSIHPLSNESFGLLKMSDPWGTGLEPAPVTPTRNSAPFDLLSGTIKATYRSHRLNNITQDIMIAPGIMSGNSDTKPYWNLTKHIFRYSHADTRSLENGIHAVNESFSLDEFVEMIKFWTTLILNADESQSI